MKNTIKVLKLLIANKNKTFSIHEISKKLKMNYRIAYGEIKKLEAQNLISIKKLGNSKQCAFNNQFHHLVMKAEEERKDEILKDKNLKVLYNELEKVKNPFYILLLFGSHARAEQKKHSDIDICIISDDRKTSNELEKAIAWMPLKLHIIKFSSDEFRQMLDTRKANVGKEILDSYIILKGMDDFYRLIN